MDLTVGTQRSRATVSAVSTAANPSSAAVYLIVGWNPYNAARRGVSTSDSTPSRKTTM